MIPSYLTQRLNDLEDNIYKDFQLLKRYEDALRLERSPVLQLNYEKNIEDLKSSAIKHKQEADEVREQIVRVSGKLAFEEQNSINNRLDDISENIKILQKGQTDILNRLEQCREALLAYYDTTQRTIVSSIIQQLNQNQVYMAQILVEELEEQSLLKMQQILALLKDKFPAVSLSQTTLSQEVIQNQRIDIKDKLMLTIPFIPGIIGYDGEFEFRSSSNEKNAWDWVMLKVGRS
ncbi:MULTISPECIES: hypothetical protein [Nostoc]|uniref:Uncharacterized protein n=1 Tax=Nostoc paludosum FACHB-159 TaxID=2692908 RepID=A0ABR8K6C0_9NOSO|nr:MULTISPECIES: hypothetical protein [Nostoc]MBD2676834.1 hypothetical protein [Nostoc sp. FACHB-857]MBD2735021.1 hypothetical protein [Nostoc paludosum FACHB-159]